MILRVVLFLALVTSAFSQDLWNCNDCTKVGPGDQDGLLNDPWGLDLDREGNLYVTELGNGRLQKFSADGRPLGWLGMTTDGGVHRGRFQKGDMPARTANRGSHCKPNMFDEPRNVVVDDRTNLIYVVDYACQNVNSFDLAGMFNGVFGAYANPFTRPMSISVDERSIYVGDGGKINRFSPQTMKRDAWLGGVEMPSGAVKGKNNWDMNGVVANGRLPGTFVDVADLAIDEKNNRMYVADGENSRIQIIEKSSGRYINSIELPKAPHHLAIDSEANVYVAMDTVEGIDVYQSKGHDVYEFSYRIKALPKPRALKVFESSGTKRLFVVLGPSGVSGNGHRIVRLKYNASHSWDLDGWIGRIK